MVEYCLIGLHRCLEAVVVGESPLHSSGTTRHQRKGGSTSRPAFLLQLSTPLYFSCTVHVGSSEGGLGLRKRVDVVVAKCPQEPQLPYC